jgi:hypothetical protein
VRSDEDDRRPDLDALAAAWKGPVPDNDQQIFLGLSIERRNVALARVAALQELTGRDTPPTRAEQEAVAARLGFTLQRLQGLMRQWRKGKSVALASPHATQKPRRPSDLPGHRIAKRIIDKALAANRWIAEPRVTKRINTVCERVGIKPPARMTIRTLLEKARRHLPEDDSDPFDMQIPGTGPDAPRPGERLILITQFFRAAIVGEDGTERWACARLLIDVLEGYILAASIQDRLDEIATKAESKLTGTDQLLPWGTPHTLYLAADLTQREKKGLLHRARKLGIEIKYPAPRTVRRWSQSILWSDRHSIAPVAPPAHRTDPPGDWPRLTPWEFRCSLEPVVSAHSELREIAIRRRGPDPRWAEEGGRYRELAAKLRKLFGEE